MRFTTITLAIFLYANFTFAQENALKSKLLETLGEFPKKQALQIDTIEVVKLTNGVRYKIKYFSEDSNPKFGLPQDWIYAYLFVPDDTLNKKKAGIVAIHQDGVNYHIGKSEPAGIAGDSTMFYGLELFNKGYVVICPDKFYHSERRLLSKLKPWYREKNVNYERDMNLFQYQAGVLMLEGRTIYSKEAFDISRAVDVLFSLDIVDKNKIGIIGHSGGGNTVPYAMFYDERIKLGNTVPYAMFYDERIKLGVSSCGIFDIARIFNMNIPQPLPASMVIPNLVKNNLSTADYIKNIYPRSLLLTRGRNEWGKGDTGSIAFIKELQEFEKAYKSNGNKGDIKIIIFEENNGKHSFPDTLRNEVYKWIDKRLK